MKLLELDIVDNNDLLKQPPILGNVMVQLTLQDAVGTVFNVALQPMEEDYTSLLLILQVCLDTVTRVDSLTSTELDWIYTEVGDLATLRLKSYLKDKYEELLQSGTSTNVYAVQNELTRKAPGRLLQN